MAMTPKYNYTDSVFLLEIEGLARDGYDDQQIAALLDLTPEGFCRIKKRIDQLNQALRRGRRPLEVLVENSLYFRAVGMRVTSTNSKYIRLPDGTETDTKIVSITITEVPPDVSAIMNWLKHRKPEVWNSQPNKSDITSNGQSLDTPEITRIEIIR